VHGTPHADVRLTCLVLVSVFSLFLPFLRSIANEHEDLDPVNLDAFEEKRQKEQRVPKEHLEPASEVLRRRILCDAMGESVRFRIVRDESKCAKTASADLPTVASSPSPPPRAPLPLRSAGVRAPLE
jgi:hypothetical protein